MNEFQENDAPTPRQLAAYGDGELDARTRARVAVWLEQHPEVAAELEAGQVLERVWAAGPLPEPSDADWVAVQKQLHAALYSRPRALPARHGLGWAKAARAAAALLVILLHRPIGKDEPPPPAATPFAVVSANDVEILSMDAADADALVIGEMPMRGPVVLAGPGDVVLDSFLPDNDMETPMRMGVGGPADSGGAPMIVVPINLARADR